jgi:hypothetical protein
MYIHRYAYVYSSVLNFASPIFFQAAFVLLPLLTFVRHISHSFIKILIILPKVCFIQNDFQPTQYGNDDDVVPVCKTETILTNIVLNSLNHVNITTYNLWFRQADG